MNEVITLRSGKKVDNKVTVFIPIQEDDVSDTENIFDERDHLEKVSKSEKPKETKGNK